MKYFWIVIGAIVFAVVGFSLLDVSETSIEDTRDHAADNSSLSNRVAREVRSSKRALEADKKRLALAAIQMSAAPSEKAEQELDEQMFMSKEVAELHEKTGAHYFSMGPAMLEEMHQEQDSNHHWSQRTEEAAAEALLYEESAGTTLSSVDCRETLCKMAFTHENLGRHKSFVNGRMDMGPWISGAGDAMGSYEVAEDGTIESFIYFTHFGDHDTFLDMRRRMADRLAVTNPTNE